MPLSTNNGFASDRISSSAEGVSGTLLPAESGASPEGELVAGGGALGIATLAGLCEQAVSTAITVNGNASLSFIQVAEQTRSIRLLC